MRYVWVDEHIYTIQVHQCYISQYYVLYMVLFLTYCDDCSVIHEMYICAPIINVKKYAQAIIRTTHQWQNYGKYNLQLI